VNKVPLCANKLLQEQLRDRMGFEGIVITDWSVAPIIDGPLLTHIASIRWPFVDSGAIGMMTGNHHWNHSNGTAYTPVEATAAAMAAGTVSVT
jgi:hypothetical protein